MARRFGLMLVIFGVLLPVTSASAATAPLEAPVLVSLPSASPVSIHWTPATTASGGEGHGHGHGHGHGGDGGTLASVQAVLRADGPCASPAGPASAIATFADTTTSDFTDAVADGTYCYSIEVTDAASTADSPGLTVIVDTLAPIAVAPSPTIAPIGGGMVMAPTSVGLAAAADLLAPTPPTRLSVSLPRSKPGVTRVPVTVRWANPLAADLARVDVVMNSRRPPRDATDGTVVYGGLATSIVLTLSAGQTRYLALFAWDRSGNVSAAARRFVSLASLVPLRPLSGTSVSAAPLLTWKPTKGAAYYNVQLFRSGKRVLVAWPSQPWYHLPARALDPGTYVWFVWPALEAARATPRFGELIGRATFVYAPG
ncbi:MAG: hypothetical protein M3Q31_25510 [Actinomycetota bacterium]|nr:hypothetical protein [Actinomycetota bacterium]